MTEYTELRRPDLVKVNHTLKQNDADITDASPYYSAANVLSVLLLSHRAARESYALVHDHPLMFRNVPYGSEIARAIVDNAVENENGVCSPLILAERVIRIISLERPADFVLQQTARRDVAAAVNALYARIIPTGLRDEPSTMTAYVKESIINYASKSLVNKLSAMPTSNFLSNPTTTSLRSQIDEYYYTLTAQSKSVKLDDPDCDVFSLITASGNNKIPFIDPFLNQETHAGLERGDLGIVVGGAGGGKSATLVSLSCDYIRAGYNVMFFSGEMSESVMLRRIMANLSGHDMNKLSAYTQAQIEQLQDLFYTEGFGKIRVNKFRAMATTVDELQAEVLAFNRETGEQIDVVVMDYIGLLVADKQSRPHDSQTHITHEIIVTKMREMCKQLNMVGWSAAQTVRDNDKTGIATLSSIAGSMGPARVADLIITMNIDQNPQPSGDRIDIMPRRSAMTIIKNRHSALTTQNSVCSYMISTHIQRMWGPIFNRNPESRFSNLGGMPECTPQPFVFKKDYEPKQKQKQKVESQTQKVDGGYYDPSRFGPIVFVTNVQESELPLMVTDTIIIGKDRFIMPDQYDEWLKTHQIETLAIPQWVIDSVAHAKKLGERESLIPPEWIIKEPINPNVALEPRDMLSAIEYGLKNGCSNDRQNIPYKRHVDEYGIVTAEDGQRVIEYRNVTAEVMRDILITAEAFEVLAGRLSEVRVEVQPGIYSAITDKHCIALLFTSSKFAMSFLVRPADTHIDRANLDLMPHNIPTLAWLLDEAEKEYESECAILAEPKVWDDEKPQQIGSLGISTDEYSAESNKLAVEHNAAFVDCTVRATKMGEDVDEKAVDVFNNITKTAIAPDQYDDDVELMPEIYEHPDHGIVLSAGDYPNGAEFNNLKITMCLYKQSGAIDDVVIKNGSKFITLSSAEIDECLNQNAELVDEIATALGITMNETKTDTSIAERAHAVELSDNMDETKTETAVVESVEMRPLLEKYDFYTDVNNANLVVVHDKIGPMLYDDGLLSDADFSNARAMAFMTWVCNGMARAFYVKHLDKIIKISNEGIKALLNDIGLTMFNKMCIMHGKSPTNCYSYLSNKGINPNAIEIIATPCKRMTIGETVNTEMPLTEAATETIVENSEQLETKPKFDANAVIEYKLKPKSHPYGFTQATRDHEKYGPIVFEHELGLTTMPIKITPDLAMFSARNNGIVLTYDELLERYELSKTRGDKHFYKQRTDFRSLKGSEEILLHMQKLRALRNGEPYTPDTPRRPIDSDMEYTTDC